MTALVPGMNIMHKNTETGRQKRALDACARSWALCLLRLKRAFKNTALQCFIMNDFGSLSSPSRHAFRRRRRNGGILSFHLFLSIRLYLQKGAVTIKPVLFQRILLDYAGLMTGCPCCYERGFPGSRATFRRGSRRTFPPPADILLSFFSPSCIMGAFSLKRNGKEVSFL